MRKNNRQWDSIWRGKRTEWNAESEHNVEMAESAMWGIKKRENDTKWKEERMTGNGIGYGGVSALGEALKVNTALTSLDLRSKEERKGMQSGKKNEEWITANYIIDPAVTNVRRAWRGRGGSLLLWSTGVLITKQPGKWATFANMFLETNSERSSIEDALLLPFHWSSLWCGTWAFIPSNVSLHISTLFQSPCVWSQYAWVCTWMFEDCGLKPNCQLSTITCPHEESWQ